MLSGRISKTSDIVSFAFIELIDEFTQAIVHSRVLRNGLLDLTDLPPFRFSTVSASVMTGSFIRLKLKKGAVNIARFLNVNSRQS